MSNALYVDEEFFSIPAELPDDTVIKLLESLHEKIDKLSERLDQHDKRVQLKNLDDPRYRNMLLRTKEEFPFYPTKSKTTPTSKKFSFLPSRFCE